MNNLVSVICTVKNGENTLEETIKSVMKQTYKNFEFIIIDDGSTDETLNLLNTLKDKYSKLKIITTDGIGRSEALNLAINNSFGKYIANIDADDLWHPQKLEIQVEVLKKNPEYFLFSTKSILFYDNESPTWSNVDKFEYFLTDIDRKLLITDTISHPSVIMQKKKLKELGLYDIDRNAQIDYELWLRAFSKNYKMGKIELELVGKRIHKHQSYENKKRIKYIWSSANLQIDYLIRLKKYHLIIFPIVKFLLGILPFKIRRKINNVIFK